MHTHAGWVERSEPIASAAAKATGYRFENDLLIASRRRIVPAGGGTLTGSASALSQDGGRAAFGSVCSPQALALRRSRMIVPSRTTSPGLAFGICNDVCGVTVELEPATITRSPTPTERIATTPMTSRPRRFGARWALEAAAFFTGTAAAAVFTPPAFGAMGGFKDVGGGNAEDGGASGEARVVDLAATAGGESKCAAVGMVSRQGSPVARTGPGTVQWGCPVFLQSSRQRSWMSWLRLRARSRMFVQLASAISNCSVARISVRLVWDRSSKLIMVAPAHQSVVAGAHAPAIPVPRRLAAAMRDAQLPSGSGPNVCMPAQAVRMWRRAIVSLGA